MKRILLLIVALLLFFSSDCLAEEWKPIVYTKNTDTVYVDYDSIKYESAIVKSTHVLTYHKKIVLEKNGKEKFMTDLPLGKRKKFEDIKSIVQIYGIALDEEHKMIGAVYESKYMDSSNNIIETETSTPDWKKLDPKSEEFGINTYSLSYAYNNFQKVLARSNLDTHNKN